MKFMHLSATAAIKVISNSLKNQQDINLVLCGMTFAIANEGKNEKLLV